MAFSIIIMGNVSSAAEVRIEAGSFKARAFLLCLLEIFLRQAVIYHTLILGQTVRGSRNKIYDLQYLNSYHR